ncbi:MAG: TrmH family RNA methyltransferase, partial [Hyphomicrobiales bacterium]
MTANNKKKNVSVALYQPDIPQNTGSIMRLTACFGVSLHIIEPAGFVIDDKRLNRVAMDYINHLEIIKHPSWTEFFRWSKSNSHRIILATTKTDQSY